MLSPGARLDDILRWGPDEVIVNGDLVNRGPCSVACLRLLREACPRARYLLGNHEDYVLACAGVEADQDHPEYDIRRMAFWTRDQLGDELAVIGSWQRNLDLTGDGGGSLHVTHGSRLGNRDGIFPGLDDQALAEKLGEARDLFIASHTHKALVRRFRGSLVVNVGSVGQPLDRDMRASYGRFTLAGGRWRAEIRRLEFDRAQAGRDFEESGFLDGAGPLGRLILRECQQARSLVGPWMRRYHQAVADGEITVARAVDEFLLAAGRHAATGRVRV